ncbi:MAG: hypothetical protein ACXAC8_19870, partial [Candidatus Hodarchaeales archaeon]
MKVRTLKLIIPMIFTIVLFAYVISTVSAQIPVINTKDLDVDTFIPSGLQDDWLYHVNPPGTDYTDFGVNYKGISGSQNGEYTYFSNYNEFSDSSVNLQRNGMVNDNLLTNVTRYGYHPLYNSEPYPRAVRIPATFNPVFETSGQREAINLHLDYSFTFMVERNTNYFGFLNTNKAFYLDIIIYDCNAVGSIVFSGAFPSSGYSIGNVEKKMTYPFIPRSDSVIPLNFTFYLDQGSLVTLTPHSWNFPNYIPTIDVNTTYFGEIDQGTYVAIQNETFIYPENEIFSVRMFNLPLIEDTYYEIFVDFVMLEYLGCTSGQPFVFLVGEHVEQFQGSLNQNGYRLYATENESVTVVFFAQGWSVGEYSIYYRNVIQEEDLVVDAAQLFFGQNIKLGYNVYYSFTLDSPHMLAVNYSYYYYFNLYIPGSEPNEWIQVGDHNFFSPEMGNLIGDSSTDIGNNWRYFPTGTYAIRVTWYWSNHEIHFTKVPILTPSTVSVNQNSIFAFELLLTQNRINFVNISTNDHTSPYQRVRYEYGWIGKYNEMIKDIYYPSSTWIGNRNDSGQWLAWGSNNTQLEAFLPARDHEVPILMIRPYDVENSTFQFPSQFSTTLTVSTNVPPVQHYANNGWNYMGNGYFIPKNQISSSTSFPVNDDVFPGTDHLYGIPLDLSPNKVYNITTYLHGNYSTGGSSWNTTFEAMNILGGNLRSLEIFDTEDFGWDETRYWTTMLILTVSSPSYLYLDVDRTFDGSTYRNATLEISIEDISAPALEFDLPPYIYNTTRLADEIFSPQLLASPKVVTEMRSPAPGFELFLTLG